MQQTKKLKDVSVEANWYFYNYEASTNGKKEIHGKNALNVETIIFLIGNVWQMSQHLK